MFSPDNNSQLSNTTGIIHPPRSQSMKGNMKRDMKTAKRSVQKSGVFFQNKKCGWELIKC